MPRFRSTSVSRRLLRKLLRIIIHRKPLDELAVNPFRHYVSERAPFAANNRTGDMTENPDPDAGFLEPLAQRVRTIPALHRISRQLLATVPPLSARPLAPLPSPTRNAPLI